MNQTKPYTVIAILEAKPNKEILLRKALFNVIQLSRAEKTCLEYRLHQEHNNPKQFILYENWQSKEAHQAQFDKPYILELAGQIGDLLAKPYQIYCAEEL